MSVNLIHQLNDEMADVVEAVRRSIVVISNRGQGHGTGIIVEPDGLILTNAHVVRDNSVQVFLPGREQALPGRIVAYDAQRDLAALRIKANDLPAMALGDSQILLPGQWVFAVGHPWGVAGAVTSGIAITSGNGPSGNPAVSGGWLAANLHLRPGKSGGPLVDIHGRLLGINTVMAGPEVGLAISVQEVKSFLKENALAIRRSASGNSANEPSDNAPEIL